MFNPPFMETARSTGNGASRSFGALSAIRWMHFHAASEFLATIWKASWIGSKIKPQLFAVWRLIFHLIAMRIAASSMPLDGAVFGCAEQWASRDYGFKKSPPQCQ